jgi:hypothetical protein
MKIQAETPLIIDAQQDSLLFFYLTLMEHLANWITPPLRWMPYAFGPVPAGTKSPIDFKYGYWYDENDPPQWAKDWPEF